MCNIYKKSTGDTIINVLHRIRIKYGKGTARIIESIRKDVANKVGISDTSYFNRIFNKIEGVSPAHFREISRYKS
jgi:two-component system, response regulator YesN